MRRLALLASLLVAGAAVAGGVLLNTSIRFEFTDCSSGGSAAQTVTVGEYLMRVTDADTFVCFASTCAAGGEKFPAGTVMVISVNDTMSMSCRSSASTGDFILTRKL